MNINPFTLEAYRIREYLAATVGYYRRRFGFPAPPMTAAYRIQKWAPKYHKPILPEDQRRPEGNDLIRARLDKSAPLMIARIGGIELSCLAYYLLHGGFAHGRTYVPYARQAVIQMMGTLPGFFPLTDECLDRFCETCLEQIRDVDIMGVMYNRHEYLVCENYCPQAALVELGCLEPFRYPHPWSSALKGKRVLVVHPFVESITHQYQTNRQLIWDDPEVLPEFELRTVKAVVSIGGAPVPFATWFDAYQSMCDQIVRVEFDVAIIGAGSYGLPLASFIKRLGKQAIHMGGVSQILFGIKGKRWETEYAGCPWLKFNEHWVRPAETEIIKNHTRFENGCYW